MYQLIPIAAKVPSTVAVIAEVKATIKLFKSACHKGFELNMSFWYQMNEKFVKVVSFDSLNEKNTITNSGKNKNKIERHSTVFDRLNLGLRFFHWRFACLFDSLLGIDLYFLFSNKIGFFICFL